MPVKEKRFVDSLPNLIWVVLGKIALDREDQLYCFSGKEETLQALFAVLKYEFADTFPVFNELHFATRKGFPHSRDVEKLIKNLLTSRLIRQADDGMLCLELDYGSKLYIEECVSSLEDMHLREEFFRLLEKLKWIIQHPESLSR